MQVIKTLVPDDKREDFLYRHLGKPFMFFEDEVYHVAGKFTDYNGGYWEFYALSNGGLFMAPDSDRQWHFQNPDNYADVTLSSEALGIVACLYAFSHLSFNHEALADYYHHLRDFTYHHTEGMAIFQAID